MAETIWILHHNDWDGIVAAWVAHHALRSPVVALHLRPIQYGHEQEALEGIGKNQRLFILDFALKPELFAKVAEDRTAPVVMLDHHKSALADWVGSRARPIVEAVGHTIVVQEGVAGCELTWRHFHGQDPMPVLVQYAADHDLWKFELPQSRTIRAAMRGYPLTLGSCDMLQNDLREDFDSFCVEGETVARFMARLVEQACEKAELMEISGHRCWASQVPFGELISDVAGHLAERKDAEFGCCWFKGQGDEWVYSLRSRGEFSVRAVAEAMGGGGHDQAAGFASANAPTSFLVR